MFGLFTCTTVASYYYYWTVYFGCGGLLFSVLFPGLVFRSLLDLITWRGMPRWKPWHPFLLPWGLTSPMFWRTSRLTGLWTCGRTRQIMTSSQSASGHSTRGPPKGRFRAAKAAEVEATQRYLSWIYVSTLPLFASTFQIYIIGKSSFLYCITQVRGVFCTVSLR